MRPFSPGYEIPPDVLLRAYASGVFPMAEDVDDPEVFWVRPESRGIIPLDDFHISRSLRKSLRNQPFEIRFNSDFNSVIEACREQRPERQESWINEPILTAYSTLFELGHCHTVEAWRGGQLVGGRYGVSLGRVFFGESMFSRETDASKICLVYLVERLKERGFVLLDTQFTTPHLKRFGAIDVPRKRYEIILAEALEGTATFL